MPDLVRQVAAGTETELSMTRAGTGHLYYSSRLQFVLTEPLPALDQGMRVERRYERFAENGDRARRPRRSRPAISSASR